MSKTDAPDDGDFARFIENKQNVASMVVLDALAAVHPGFGAAPFATAVPDAESAEEIAALRAAPPLSDEELERQALADGDADDFIDEAPEPEDASGTAPTEQGIEADFPPLDYLNVGSVALEVAGMGGELEEEIAAMQDLPLSDEELERQALAGGGADGDSVAQ